MLVGLVLAIVIGAVVLGSTVLRPPPATARLAGVRVLVAGYSIANLGEGKRHLNLSVTVDSARNIDECLAFAIDEPFGSRRVESADGSCVRPKAGRLTAGLVFDRLTDDDLAFPDHTIVWGIPVGRCGFILEAFGVCVVEQAGTTSLTLPSRSMLPSPGPLGTFRPFFSFPAP